MKPPPEEPRSGQEAPKPRPLRLDEARRIIEEKANDLPEIIKKVHRRLEQ